MDVSVLPIAAMAGASQGGHRPSLQPGQVLDAVVARVIDAAHVQLALGNTLLDVMTEVPLAAGAHVHLAVKNTNDGLKLVLMPGVAGGPVPSAPAGQGSAALPATAAQPGFDGAAGSRTAALAAGEVSVPTGVARPVASPAAPSPVAAALGTAVRAAAAGQLGLAPLLADVAVAAKLPGLPDAVRQAATQLLALQLPSDQPVAADALRRAFARSGLFLEANLEAGASSPAAGASQAMPADLKSALLALRAALTQSGAPPSGNAPAALAAAPGGDAAAAAALANAMSASLARGAADAPALLRTLLQAAGEPSASQSASGPGTAPQNPAAAAPPLPHSSPPAPPYRGALPVAQPAADAMVDVTQPPDHVARVLLAETDGALARQTLLQAASLPDQSGLPSQHTDSATQRWVFEIPIATPQGPAIAQFEIAGDGKGRGSKDAAGPVWRARFALDIEPLGPVHAQVAVSGERTSVTLWAERAASAAMLRNQAQELNEALRSAELEPLEVLVRDGAPRPPPAKRPVAGHFVDCAS